MVRCVRWRLFSSGRCRWYCVADTVKTVSLQSPETYAVHSARLQQQARASPVPRTALPPEPTPAQVKKIEAWVYACETLFRDWNRVIRIYPALFNDQLTDLSDTNNLVEVGQ